jgi:hypothetical protein
MIFVLDLHNKHQGTMKNTKAAVFKLRSKPHIKNFFWAPQWGFGGAVLYMTKT